MTEIIICCDARPSSSLNWKAMRHQALQAVASGKKILWHLDFGLFSNLQKPLEDLGQFASFKLAIEHFKDKLWEEFQKFSIGIALFQGNADYLAIFPWSDLQKLNLSNWLKERFDNPDQLHLESKGLFKNFESFPTLENMSEEGSLILSLFARDVCSDYLEQLALFIPEAITPFVLFDRMPIDPLLRALLTDPEVYEKISCRSPNKFSWQYEDEKQEGVYMPATAMVRPSLLLPYRKILFKPNVKLIPENRLIEALNGLDKLYFHKEAISATGKRKIQGFLAAGGEIEYL